MITLTPELFDAMLAAGAEEFDLATVMMRDGGGWYDMPRSEAERAAKSIFDAMIQAAGIPLLVVGNPKSDEQAW